MEEFGRSRMGSSGGSRLVGGVQTGEEEEDEEVEENERRHDAWDRAYADERSWEELQEDESGLLRPIDTNLLHHSQYRRRARLLSSSSPSSPLPIQKGLIRFLYIVVDLSRAASESDFRPSRMVVLARNLDAFIKEFFDQNPLSQIGIVSIKDGTAHLLTHLGGSPETHIKALMDKLECSGDSSLQNALDLVHGYLNEIPSYGHREVLILYSALSTCDPGDITETIRKCKESKIRCSIIGLSAEVFICKHICQETGGSYSVSLDESHMKELMWEQVAPAAAIAEYAVPSLIRMGFPQRAGEGMIWICGCHKEAKRGGEGYMCPRCKTRVCDLPTDCSICGLTLVSSPHLARSYHHLFPVPFFFDHHISCASSPITPSCFACHQILLSGKKGGNSVKCSKCGHVFCLDCDIYIHESLHNCPGCESSGRTRKTASFPV